YPSISLSLPTRRSSDLDIILGIADGKHSLRRNAQIIEQALQPRALRRAKGQNFEHVVEGLHQRCPPLDLRRELFTYFADALRLRSEEHTSELQSRENLV